MKILLANREDLNTTVIKICATKQIALLSTLYSLLFTLYSLPSTVYSLSSYIYQFESVIVVRF
jgi:hypothetical protein